MDYNPEVGDRICRLIVEGKSLRKICTRKDMPSLSTAMKWLRETREFAQQYAHARDSAGDTFADYIVDLVEKASERNYNSMRVKIDALKWIASKLKPRRYGDRLELAGPPPPKDPKDDLVLRDAAKRIAFVLAKASRGEPLQLPSKVVAETATAETEEQKS